MMFLMNIFGGFFSYTYKQIGISVNISDNVLTWAGQISALVQAGTRLSFGALYDKFGFKKLFFILCVINIINSAGCYPARQITWLYFICIQLNYFTLAGIFAIFPVSVANTFGKKYGAAVYPLVVIASPISAVLITLLEKYVYPVIHMQNMMLIGTACSTISFFVLFGFEEKLDVQNLIKRDVVD
jgi:MFS family permease